MQTHGTPTQCDGESCIRRRAGKIAEFGGLVTKPNCLHKTHGQFGLQLHVSRACFNVVSIFKSMSI